jgi:hypothetical protein
VTFGPLKKHDMQRELSIQLYQRKTIKEAGMLVSLQSFVKDKPAQDKNKVKPRTTKKLPLFYTEPIFHGRDNDPL